MASRTPTLIKESYLQAFHYDSAATSTCAALIGGGSSEAGASDSVACIGTSTESASRVNWQWQTDLNRSSPTSHISFSQHILITSKQCHPYPSLSLPFCPFLSLSLWSQADPPLFVAFVHIHGVSNSDPHQGIIYLQAFHYDSTSTSTCAALIGGGSSEAGGSDSVAYRGSSASLSSIRHQRIKLRTLFYRLSPRNVVAQKIHSLAIIVYCICLVKVQFIQDHPQCPRVSLPVQQIDTPGAGPVASESRSLSTLRLVDRSMTVPFPFCCSLILPSFGWKTSMGVPENMLWPRQIATQGQWNEMALGHFLADKPLSSLIQILVHIQRQSQRNYSPKIPGISPPNIRWSDPVWGTAWSRRDSSSCSSCFSSWEFLLSISSSSWSWIGINKNHEIQWFITTFPVSVVDPIIIIIFSKIE